MRHREEAIPRRYATLTEAAEYAAVNPRTLRRRIAAGDLTGFRMGPRVVRVDLNELDRLLVSGCPAGDRIA